MVVRLFIALCGAATMLVQFTFLTNKFLCTSCKWQLAEVWIHRELFMAVLADILGWQKYCCHRLATHQGVVIELSKAIFFRNKHFWVKESQSSCFSWKYENVTVWFFIINRLFIVNILLYDCRKLHSFAETIPNCAKQKLQSWQTRVTI